VAAGVHEARIASIKKMLHYELDFGYDDLKKSGSDSSRSQQAINEMSGLTKKEDNIMAKAIVLITADPGMDREVAGQMKKIKGVENVYLVTGLYDIVAEVQAPDDASMVALAYDKIRPIDGIRETHTMFCLAV
jgi:DNA-binding Lrp family transcriptional regulator